MKILGTIKGALKVNRGFSLAELLVTVGILVTVIIILLQLFVYNSVLAELSGNMHRVERREILLICHKGRGEASFISILQTRVFCRSRWCFVGVIKTGV